MSENGFLELSADNVVGAIGLNPSALSRNSLSALFGLNKKELDELNAILNQLEEDGVVEVDQKGSYQATQPMADLAFAKIKTIDEKGRGILDIKGTSDSFAHNAMVSARVMGKWKAKVGDEFLVRLNRYQQDELRAQIISRRKHQKPLKLAVKFTQASKDGAPQVVALDKHIKTVFKALGHPPPKEGDLKSSWVATFPHDYDPYNPKLIVERQKEEIESGKSIPLILANKYGVRPRHSKAAKAEAKQLAKIDVNYEIRRDLSHEPILIIDPPNPFDRDDGVMVEYDHERNMFRSLCVIADVAEYVRPDTQVAEEAFARGTSHFFAYDRRVYPMLPPQLVKSCSLIDGKRRPVFFSETFWDTKGNEVENRIGLGYIQSQRTLTYGQMEEMMYSDQVTEYDDYREFLDAILINDTCSRADKLDLQDEPTNARLYAPSSQFLVNFMMNHTGTKVAEFGAENDIPLMYRVHAAGTDEDQYDRFRDDMEQLGIDVPCRLSELHIRDINHALDEARKMPDEVYRYVDQSVRRLLTRAQYQRAPNWHHGLSLDTYSHATSPIRRLSDLVTQKALHRVLKPWPYSKETGLSTNEEERLDELVRSANTTELKAERIAKEYADFNKIQDLLRFEGHLIRTVLHAIHHDSVELLYHKNGLTMLVEQKDLPAGWVINRDQNRVDIMHPNRQVVSESLFPGDFVRGTVENVNPPEGTWDFDIRDGISIQDKLDRPLPLKFAEPVNSP